MKGAERALVSDGTKEKKITAAMSAPTFCRAVEDGPLCSGQLLEHHLCAALGLVALGDAELNDRSERGRTQRIEHGGEVSWPPLFIGDAVDDDALDLGPHVDVERLLPIVDADPPDHVGKGRAVRVRPYAPYFQHSDAVDLGRDELDRPHRRPLGLLHHRLGRRRRAVGRRATPSVSDRENQQQPRPGHHTSPSRDVER